MAQTSIDFDLLRQQCQQAAFGDLSWETLLSNICTWVDGDRAMMLQAYGKQPYSVSFCYNFDLAEVMKYNSQYNGRDPRMPLSKLTPSGQTRTGQQYLPNEHIKDTEYFDVVSRGTDILDSAHSIIMDNDITGRQAISIHRSFKNEFFQHSDVEKIQALLPHLTDAFEYSMRVAGQFSLKTSQQDCTLLVKDDLKSHVLSGDLLAVLMGCTALSWNGEFLRPKNNALKQFFYSAVNLARMGKSCQCTLQIEDPTLIENRPFIQITAMSCPSVIDWLPNVKSQIMLHVCRIESAYDECAVEMFCNIYQLTPAESRTLVALMKSCNLKQAATQLNISYETVRWHLKNIFQKTGHSTQAALVRAVTDMDLSRTDFCQ